MSHEVESAVYVDRKPAWHGLGNVVADKALKADKALDLAGLKWGVEKIPLFGIATGPDGKEYEVDVPLHKAVIRTYRMETLGVVGHQYGLVQNLELLEFCEVLQDTGEAVIQTAGSLRGGRIVWATCLVDKDVKIAGLEDERIDPFLFLTNAHDGSESLSGHVTPIRTVCMNTKTLAIARAVRSWRLRHSSGIQGRLQDARDALGITFKYLEQFEVVGNSLVEQKMSKREFADFLEALVPYDEMMLASIAAGERNRAAKNVDEARRAIASIYETAPDLENIRGRKYAALNAVTAYVDWTKPQRQILDASGSEDTRAMMERRFVKVVIESDLKQKALRLLDPKLAHAKGDNLQALAAAAR